MMPVLPPYVQALDAPAEHLFAGAFQSLSENERAFLDARAEPTTVATLPPRARFSLVPRNVIGRAQADKGRLVVYDDAQDPAAIARHELAHLLTKRLMREDISSFPERATRTLREHAAANPQIISMLKKAHPETHALFTSSDPQPRALDEVLAVIYQGGVPLLPVFQKLRDDLDALALFYGQGFGF